MDCQPTVAAPRLRARPSLAPARGSGV